MIHIAAGERHQTDFALLVIEGPGNVEITRGLIIHIAAGERHRTDFATVENSRNSTRVARVASLR